MLNEGVERSRDQRALTGEKEISSDKLSAGALEFLATPLLMGLVCLIRQGRF